MKIDLNNKYAENHLGDTACNKKTAVMIYVWITVIKLHLTKICI